MLWEYDTVFVSTCWFVEIVLEFRTMKVILVGKASRNGGGIFEVGKLY